jgi:hypothetical protein
LRRQRALDVGICCICPSRSIRPQSFRQWPMSQTVRSSALPGGRGCGGVRRQGSKYMTRRTRVIRVVAPPSTGSLEPTAPPVGSTREPRRGMVCVSCSATAGTLKARQRVVTCAAPTLR